MARPDQRLGADAVQHDLALLDGYAGPQWTVEQVDLVASHPGTRSDYERLWSVPVGP